MPPGPTEVKLQVPVPNEESLVQTALQVQIKAKSINKTQLKNIVTNQKQA